MYFILQKPTAPRFYKALFDEFNLKELAELGVTVVKNKMRNLKTMFTKAEDWRQSTGAGLLEEGNEASVKGKQIRLVNHPVGLIFFFSLQNIS